MLLDIAHRWWLLLNSVDGTDASQPILTKTRGSRHRLSQRLPPRIPMADTQPTAAIPSNARARQLRACLLCSIIQSPVDFRRNGCPNCEEIMQMKQSQDRVASCTTTHFDGVIAVIDPEASWVARWQRTCAFFLSLSFANRSDG